jgi:hypothetical protein
MDTKCSKFSVGIRLLAHDYYALAVICIWCGARYLYEVAGLILDY